MIQTTTLATLTYEGFVSPILRIFDDVTLQEIVKFTADLDVDADGANGQHGLPIAYLVNNKGRERLVDIGYPRDPDEYSDGLICLPGTRQPKVFDSAEGQFYASRTALRMPGFAADDPRCAVDAEFFPYVVVPPIVRTGTRNKVLGSHGIAVNHRNGLSSDFVVADIGPAKKDGEGSPALCRAVGVNDDPLCGGLDTPDISYTIFVGVPAIINGFQFALQ